MFEKINTRNVIKNNKGDLPATTAILSNNQIGKYISRENATILKNVFSATANGFGKVFYQPKEFTVLQDSYAFKFIDKSIKIEKIHSFIVASLNKIYSKYNWGYKSGWNKVKEEQIKLPTKDHKIDFDFMESFVAELEARRVAELEAYLKVTGLNDYIKTKEEEKAIADFKAGKVEFSNIKIKDIFTSYTGKDFIIGKAEEGEIPLVSHQNIDNGIVKFVKENPKYRLFDFRNTIGLADRGIFHATTQTKDFYIGTRVKALVFKKGNSEIKERLFFVTSINKLKMFFMGYSENATNKLPELEIKLPIKNNEIDYKYMEIFVSAIQKEVIENVVKYLDLKIETTKKVVFDD